MNFQKKQTEERPWLNCEKKLRPDSEIQEMAATWSVETWENFLSATIDKELSAHEVLWDEYEDLLEEQTETIWTGSSRLPEHVHRQVHIAIRSLSPSQRAVIRGIYFHRLTESRLGQKLKINQSAVNRTKNLCLSKIKHLLESDVITAAYLIGGSKNLAPRSRSRIEQIIEIYLEDLNGSYLK